MINSRAIKDLHWIMQEKCKLHIEACKKRGVDIIVTSTLRDDAYQATLYAQGRTKPGLIVTKLKVTGAHGLGLAYDIVPVIKGVAIYKPEQVPIGHKYTFNELWNIAGEEGQKLGLEWGGSWTDFLDRPHFELTDGLTFKQLRAGKRPVWFNNKPSVTKPTVKPETKAQTTKPTGGVKVGDVVRIEVDAGFYSTGQKIPTSVKLKSYTVAQIKSDRVLLKEIMSWCKITDVTKV